MADGSIVVAGEALVDLVPTPAGDLRPHLGGGPYNTARTLARLERPVSFLGCVSADGFGDRLRAGLAEDGVRLDAVAGTDLPTTLALVEMDESGSAGYRFYTEATSAPALTPEAALAVLPEPLAILHVGTLGLVLEPLATAVSAVVERVAGSALVVVDPNCRPALIPDRTAYRRRLAGILARSHVVKASVEDLAWLEPGLPPASAARTLLEDGPRVALVTLGGEGALVVTHAAEQTVAAPTVPVVDTIGAGDAFAGGFVAWWSTHGLGREELADLGAVLAATDFACVVAARTCERAGASPPRLAELDLTPK
jgi:fructokinase